MKVDALARQKNSKRHFLKDIENSFHQVNHIGLEPHQNFSFWNISTHTVARDVQSFSKNGPWLAGCFLSNLHRYMMNICWKFQDDVLILFWTRAEWLKICCNNRPTPGDCCWWIPRVGLLMQHVFSHSAITYQESRYLFEIFSICSSCVSANLKKKFWQ